MQRSRSIHQTTLNAKIGRLSPTAVGEKDCRVFGVSDTRLHKTNLYRWKRARQQPHPQSHIDDLQTASAKCLAACCCVMHRRQAQSQFALRVKTSVPEGDVHGLYPGDSATSRAKLSWRGLTSMASAVKFPLCKSRALSHAQRCVDFSLERARLRGWR